MEIRELICIGCPMGCPLKVELEEGKVRQVTGTTCNRGDVYARKEVTDPTRIVTTTVRVNHGEQAVVSVKTRTDIPKDKISACMEAIKKVRVDAPIKIGDVVAADIAGTGVDMVATKNISVL